MILYILLSREKFELNFEYSIEFLKNFESNSPKFARIELIRRFDRSPTQTILPWCPADTKSGLDVVSGGSVTVERVNIDPLSHGFAKFLEGVCMS
jgi:hypothetical protein